MTRVFSRNARNVLAASIVLVQVLVLWGCSPVPHFDDLTIQETYDAGAEAAARGDHLVATEAFSRITLNSPMHDVADDALLGLADTYRSIGDYASAEEAYWRLLADYPRSPLVGEAMYKLGVAYYEQSPPAALDQQMTLQAIDQLGAFEAEHPDSPFVPDARAKVGELRTRLARKDYDSAMLYVSLKSPEGARVYLEAVAEDYSETVWGRRSLLEFARILCAEGSMALASEAYGRLIEEHPGTEEATTAATEAQSCGR
jgi:outer membrane protein assembly factor BamD